MLLRRRLNRAIDCLQIAFRITTFLQAMNDVKNDYWLDKQVIEGVQVALLFLVRVN